MNREKLESEITQLLESSQAIYLDHVRALTKLETSDKATYKAELKKLKEKEKLADAQMKRVREILKDLKRL